jgi:hypothetical protein
MIRQTTLVIDAPFIGITIVVKRPIVIPFSILPWIDEPITASFAVATVACP